MSILSNKHSGVSVGHLDSRYVNVTGDTMTGSLTIDGSSDTKQLVIQGYSTQTANLTEWQNSSGTAMSSVTPIGSWYSTPALTAANSLTGGIGLFLSPTITAISADSSGYVMGADFLVQGTANFNLTGGGFLTGFQNSTNIAVASGKTLANVMGGRIGYSLTGTGTVTNAYRINLGDFNAGGATITNEYGLYIANVNDGVTLNYAIYTNAGLNNLGDQLKVDGSADRTQLIVQGHSTQTANLQEWQNSSGTALSYIRGDGRLAIDVNNTSTSGVIQAAFLRISPQPTADTSGSYQGFSGQITGTYNFNATGYIAGVHGSIFAYPATGKSITWAAGIQSRVNNAGAGTIINAALFRGEQLQDGLFTNAYGLYLPSIAAGATLNYAIYTNAGLNRLGDQLSIVGSADRIQLSVKANATQTANLLELLPNASSTPLAYFSSVGSLRIQTATTVLATLINTEPSGSSTGAYINLYERDGAPLVSGDRLGGFIMGGSRNISNTTNNSVAFNAYAIETWSDTQAGARCTFEVCPSGSINRTVIAGIYGNGLVLGTTTSAPTGLLQLNGIADATQLIVKANATQTANLTEWQNSSGTVLAYVEKAGLIKSSGRKKAVAIKSANYTLTTNDEVVVFTATATATLPAATGTGQTYRIVCRAGVTTIDANGSETIKGELTQTLIAGENLIITDTASGIWE